MDAEHVNSLPKEKRRSVSVSKDSSMLKINKIDKIRHVRKITKTSNVVNFAQKLK